MSAAKLLRPRAVTPASESGNTLRMAGSLLRPKLCQASAFSPFNRLPPPILMKFL